VARGNWHQYRAVYEHQGRLEDNPILADAQWFRAFLKDYSVMRTIRSGHHDAFREALRTAAVESPAKLDDVTGGVVDELDHEFRGNYGTHDGRTIRSCLSKIASFLRPDTFIAWDTFARAGLNRVQGRAASRSFNSYRDYLKDVNEVLHREQESILAVVDGSVPSPFAAEGQRFSRRVLDVALMRVGGRTL
jgi:hypothetical protein